MYIYHKKKALERAVTSLRVHYKRQVEPSLEQANVTRPVSSPPHTRMPPMEMLSEHTIDTGEVPVVPPNSVNSFIESFTSC